MKRVALPEELSRLKHMIIELWIDQKGFRAVDMQLMEYSPRTRSLHPYKSAENFRRVRRHRRSSDEAENICVSPCDAG